MQRLKAAYVFVFVRMAGFNVAALALAGRIVTLNWEP